MQHVAHLARPDEQGQALASGYGAVEAGVLLEVGDLPRAAPGVPRPDALNWAVSTDWAAPRGAVAVRRLLYLLGTAFSG